MKRHDLGYNEVMRAIERKLTSFEKDSTNIKKFLWEMLFENFYGED